MLLFECLISRAALSLRPLDVRHRPSVPSPSSPLMHVLAPYVCPHPRAKSCLRRCSKLTSPRRATSHSKSTRANKLSYERHCRFDWNGLECSHFQVSVAPLQSLDEPVAETQVLRLTLPGKRPVDAKAFWNGLNGRGAEWV